MVSIQISVHCALCAVPISQVTGVTFSGTHTIHEMKILQNHPPKQQRSNKFLPEQFAQVQIAQTGIESFSSLQIEHSADGAC